MKKHKYSNLGVIILVWGKKLVERLAFFYYKVKTFTLKLEPVKLLLTSNFKVLQFGFSRNKY
jgi:hypothetical protein